MPSRLNDRPHCRIGKVTPHLSGNMILEVKRTGDYDIEILRDWYRMEKMRRMVRHGEPERTTNWERTID